MGGGLKPYLGDMHLLGGAGVDVDTLGREFKVLLAFGTLALELFYDILWGLEQLALIEDLFTRLADYLLRQTRHRLMNLQA
jgi:hypothetical protein